VGYTEKNYLQLCFIEAVLRLEAVLVVSFIVGSVAVPF